MFKAGVTVFVMLTAVAPVMAQQTTDEVDDIVVTGSRATDQLNKIPTTTTVINLEDLEAQNALSVADALRQLPGIHVVQASGQGGSAKVFIRGADQELTMILLDGVRVNDPNDSRGSPFDFSTINIADIERIEIVRGPQSAVYGSDALAGVINIISKIHADEFGGSLFAEAGSDDFYRGSFGLSGPIGDNGGFTVRVMSKDDGEPVRDTMFSSDSVSAQLSFGGDDSWRLRVFGNYADSSGTAFPEESGGAELAVLPDTDTRSADSKRFGINSRIPLAESWELNVLATWFEHSSEFLSPGIASGVRDAVPPNGADSILERSDMAVNAVVHVNEELTATFGFDYYDEDGTSDGFVEFFPGFVLPAGFEISRNVAGVFGEVHYTSRSGITLMASVRRDDSNDASGETTSRLGVLYNFGNGLTSARANWGQGFSLPGFFALASPLVGNPDLRPESSESYDIGISHQFGASGVQATVTLFHNEFKNLIDFDDTIFQMVNRDALDVDGVELQLDYAISEQLSVHAQATHMDMKLAGSDLPLSQRPDWRAGLTLRWTGVENLDVDTSWLYTGETFDSSVPTGAEFLDSYNRFDLTASYGFSDSLRAVLSVTNLLDEEYYEAIGFPAAGTRTRLGIRYDF